MHIEPGFVAPAKVAIANVTAMGLLGLYAKGFIKNPFDIVKMVLAAIFFSIFMQGFHMNVGPSELHFVGGMAIYLTLGFVPTLFGFAAGLLLQGLLFEPMDLPHLAVNSLSLILPLILVHYTAGRKLFDKSLGKRVSWKEILKLDAIFYSGVTGMVGFWLLIGEVETPFSSWLAFTGSYLAVVATEPVFTYFSIRALKSYEGSAVVDKCFSVKELDVA